MKKNTIYTLLCTTIMISSVSLAADNDGAPKTPVSKLKQMHEDKTPLTPVRSIEQQLRAIPKTPSQEDQEKKYLPKNSPYTSKYLAKRDILEIRSEHAEAKVELFRQLEEEKYKKERSKLEEQQNERYNSLLEQQIKEKEAEEERNAEIERMRLREDSIKKDLEQKKSEIEVMEKELTESKAATAKQREQKIDIMDKSDEIQEKLTKKLKETEEKYKTLTIEHYQVKLKLDGLTFEKEVNEKVKSKVNSGDKSGQQSKAILEKELEIIPNISSPSVTTPVPQSSVVNSNPQTTVPLESELASSAAQPEKLQGFKKPSGVNLKDKK